MSGVRRAGTVGFDQEEVGRSGLPCVAKASTLSEHKAVFAGIRAGDAARARFDHSGVLVLFGKQATSDPALPRLEALQTSAELRRALLPRGLDVPASSLVAMGFTIAQIACFDEMITGVPDLYPDGSGKVRKSPAAGAQPMSRKAVRDMSFDKARRPGWIEVTIGVAMTAFVGFGLGSQMWRLGLDPMTNGLVLAAWSGIACFAGFAVAWWYSGQFLPAFGVRATTRCWLLVAVAVGIVTFVAKGIFVLTFTALTGIGDNPQSVYADGGSGGMMSLLTATFLIGIVVPIGEELLFRGVLTTVLLRYGSLIGVIGSAVVFALLHGISIVFPAAVVLGLVAGEIYRRSRSIWPAVVVHTVYNLPTVPVMVLAAGVT